MPKKKEKVVMVPRPPSPTVTFGDRPSSNLSRGTTIRISEESRDWLVARSTSMEQTYDYVIRELMKEANKWNKIYQLLDEEELDLKEKGPEVVRLVKEAAALAKKGRQK